MQILFIGDVFGKQGRRAIKMELPNLIQRHHIDCVIANAENCTHGRSLSIKHYQELQNAGVNYFTFGNHTWRLDEVYEVLKKPNVVRPLNIKPSINESKYGVGSITFTINNTTIRLTNLLGNTVICNDIQDNPFPLFQEFLKHNKQDIHIVDFHTETTSEKNAFLLTFASQVDAILCTHTHVQTADEKIHKGTAYITDVGMTGGSLGVIGAKPDTILDMFMGKSERFKLEPADAPYQLNAVLLNFDDKNKIKSINRIFILEGHSSKVE